MKLDKLTIKSNGEEFTVMVNPKEFSTTDSIGYVNSRQKQCKKYKGKNSTRISIPDIFLDTTGAIPVEEWPLDGTIDQMIEKLKKMVYKFDGDAHETPFPGNLGSVNLFVCCHLFLRSKRNVEIPGADSGGCVYRRRVERVLVGLFPVR